MKRGETESWKGEDRETEERTGSVTGLTGGIVN